MKISKGFVLREVSGANGEVSNVVITVGAAAKKLNGMITLNDTCALIWKMVEKGCDELEIATEITKLYDVSLDEAKADVIDVINRFKEIGAIDE